jgi:hypothetical protein
MRYTVEHLIPEDQYSDKWETVMIAKLIREDGNTGDVWIVAGVPRQYHQTATIVGHEHGLRSVRVYGDSPPESYARRHNVTGYRTDPERKRAARNKVSPERRAEIARMGAMARRRKQHA